MFDPLTLFSVPMQIKLCIERGFQRLKGDMTTFFSTIFGNVTTSLILGSVFYNLKQDTSTFYSRGALLFFAILMNAFRSPLEVCILFLPGSYSPTNKIRFIRSTFNVLSSKNTLNMHSITPSQRLSPL